MPLAALRRWRRPPAALIGLTCQGNSTAELNGVSITDRRNEHQFTGTAILSWKPIDDLLVYGSYSRGYKAGGFNLDRSALKSPVLPFALRPRRAGRRRWSAACSSRPRRSTRYEIGAKYATGPFSLSVAAFRQEFQNFQLNTFDGTVFIVQNVNGCSSAPERRRSGPEQIHGRGELQCGGRHDGSLRVGQRRLRRAGAGRRAGGLAGADARLPRDARRDVSATPSIATTWSAPAPARRLTRHCARCRASGCRTRRGSPRPARSR